MEIIKIAGENVKGLEVNITPPDEFVDYVKRLAENLVKGGYLLKSFSFNLDYLYDTEQEENMELPAPRRISTSYKVFTRGNQWS